MIRKCSASVHRCPRRYEPLDEELEVPAGNGGHRPAVHVASERGEGATRRTLGIDVDDTTLALHGATHVLVVWNRPDVQQRDVEESFGHRAELREYGLPLLRRAHHVRENPHAFDMDRPRIKEHLAFGRGAHTCIGAPLARREVAISIERLLARMGNIRLSEKHHGPENDRRYFYEPTYILRAMRALHLEFDPQ